MSSEAVRVLNIECDLVGTIELSAATSYIKRKQDERNPAEQDGLREVRRVSFCDPPADDCRLNTRGEIWP